MVSAFVRQSELADRVGGLVMAGFDGTSLSETPADLIANLAGAIFFRRNISTARQTWDLASGLQKAAAAADQLPLLIAADQEGGSVSRLSSFGTTTPSAMALGAADDEELTEEVYALIGSELAAVGINLDFAPVADINNNPRNPVIGTRAFGEDPTAVAKHVVAAVRGLQSRGVGATAKHFPGHGDTALDSHLDLPVVRHSAARLRAIEMVPFAAAVAAGVDAIMTAHIWFPLIDRPSVPATMSAAILRDLLREELGYEGVICTDCMRMEAVAARYPPAQAAWMALSAGADLVLFSNGAELVRQAIDGLRIALSQGRLNPADVARSLERVEALRRRLGSGARSPELGSVGSAEHGRVAYGAALRSITWLRDPQRVLPVSVGLDAKVVVVQFAGSALTPVEGRVGPATPLAQALSRGKYEISELFLGLDPAPAEYASVIEAARSATAIVAVTRRAAHNHGQARAVADLAMLNKALIVIAAREPYDAAVVPPNAAVLACYGDDEQTMQAAADVLLGDARAAGRLPVRVPSASAWSAAAT
ncbi:MAG: beta-N-acetylhexosaminidase [Candidatus Eremiobacteraeota bacterium]|nr:beta-N-acetylhexosaminidase [Candidatus Eremiobacteraeota bacterium]